MPVHAKALSAVEYGATERGDEVRWAAAAAILPNASLYHDIRWRGLIERVFGHRTHYLHATARSGEVVGLLPLVQLKSALFGNYLVSMPYFNDGGAVAADAYIEEGLMYEAQALARRLNVSHVEFRGTRARPAQWPARDDKVTMTLDLPDSSDALWKQLSTKLRAQIKRPQREGVEIVRGGLELIPEFWRVFAVNMRDLGTPVYPQRFFEELLRTFHESASVVVVRQQGAPVAAALLLGFRNRLEIPWASSLREFNHLSVNMALYWECLRLAIDGGFSLFDFGRCSRDSGTYRFKKQWGAQEQPLYWHYWLRDGGEPPRLNPDNPKYRMAIAAWRKLPLRVTTLLGPHIVKYLP